MNTLKFEVACYQDLVENKQLFHKVGDKYMEIVVGKGKHCSTISGDTYFMGWMWKGYSIGGGQGHLHKTKYKNISAYLSGTQSSPILFVAA